MNWASAIMHPDTREDFGNAEAFLAIVGSVLFNFFCLPAVGAIVLSETGAVLFSAMNGITIGCAIGGIRFAKGKRKLLAWAALILFFPWLIELPVSFSLNWTIIREYWTNPIYR